MHTDVNVIHTRRLGQILLEVLHVCDEELLLAGEILVDLPVLIEDVNDNDLLLLLTAAGLLEAVVDPSLASGDRRDVAPARGTRAHASTCLLLLQVLRP